MPDGVTVLLHDQVNSLVPAWVCITKLVWGQEGHQFIKYYIIFMYEITKPEATQSYINGVEAL